MIWKTTIDLNLANERGKNTMSEHLGIEFIDVGDDYLVARMPVDHRTKQPMGIMNGGASCVLAETSGQYRREFLCGHYYPLLCRA